MCGGSRADLPFVGRLAERPGTRRYRPDGHHSACAPTPPLGRRGPPAGARPAGVAALLGRHAPGQLHGRRAMARRGRHQLRARRRVPPQPGASAAGEAVGRGVHARVVPGTAPALAEREIAGTRVGRTHDVLRQRRARQPAPRAHRAVDAARPDAARPWWTAVARMRTGLGCGHAGIPRAGTDRRRALAGRDDRPAAGADTRVGRGHRRAARGDLALALGHRLRRGDGPGAHGQAFRARGARRTGVAARGRAVRHASGVAEAAPPARRSRSRCSGRVTDCGSTQARTDATPSTSRWPPRSASSRCRTGARR